MPRGVGGRSSPEPARRRPPISRRALLATAGLAGAGIVATRILPRDQFDASAGSRERTTRWSDPSTWEGDVPRPSDVATISSSVLLDADVDVAGVLIESGGRLTFDPRRTTRLRSTGNVLVMGGLRMRPASDDVEHRLVFDGVDERSFVGGGSVVLDSDVGLWVMGGGELDVAGSPKTPWVLADGEARRGSKTLSLAMLPAGWRVGDEIAVTPTVPPTARGFATAYDHAVIEAIGERTVTLSAPLDHDHPTVEVGSGAPRGAEILNLSRNVLIEGAPVGRSHIFIRSRRPQTIAYAGVRYMGPRRVEGTSTTFVPGRYGIHFHECFHGSRGSIVRGVVVRESGSHAFVPHRSDGVTFRGCVSHDTLEDAFWWDDEHHSHDTSFIQCVASLVRSDPPFRGYSLTGFVLGGGSGNAVRACVAVGVQGTSTSSGFHWPGKRLSDGVWDFDLCSAHNNAYNGIYAWQNSRKDHVISRFIAFHNGRSGVLHGAYRNHYRYRDCMLVSNLGSAMELWANPDDAGIEFDGVLFDGGASSDFAVITGRRVAKPQARTRFTRCRFRRYRVAGFGAVGDRASGSPRTAREALDFVDCSWDANEFWLAGDIDAGSSIRVDDADRGSILLQRIDRPGRLIDAWNARVTQIEPFA